MTAFKQDGSFDWQDAFVPVALLLSVSLVLIILLVNALTHKFKVDFKWSLIGTGIYFVVIIALVVLQMTVLENLKD